MMHRLRVGGSHRQLAIHSSRVICPCQKRWSSDLSNTDAGTDVVQEKRISIPRRTFVHHQEPTGQVWYTIKSKLQRIKRPENPKFFEMPDLVIDLDAEDQKGIREFNLQDENIARKRWGVNHKREAMETFVSRLESDAAHLRQSWADILAQPSNPWRITPHDLISVALGGVTSGTLATNLRGIGPADDPAYLHFLCEMNGIPEYAIADDKSVLEWMLIRKEAMEQIVSQQSGQLPSATDFFEALQVASSLLELRRVIATCSLGSLGNEHNAITAFGQDGNIAVAIEDAIRRLLNAAEPESPEMENAIRQAMTIVGNAEINLQDQNPRVSALLWAFGSQLAKSHSLVATIESIRRCLQAEHEHAVPEVSNIVADMIDGLASTLEDLYQRDPAHIYHMTEAPALLGILIGNPNIEDHERTYSVRSFVLDSRHLSLDLRLNLYKSYIALLGRLGAVRVLWLEHQHRFQVMKGLDVEYRDLSSAEAEISQAILAAASTAPALETIQDYTHRRNITLGQCAIADYEDFVSRTDTGSIERSPTPMDMAKLKKAIGGSLRGWLIELGRHEPAWPVDQEEPNPQEAYSEAG